MFQREALLPLSVHKIKGEATYTCITNRRILAYYLHTNLSLHCGTIQTIQSEHSQT